MRKMRLEETANEFPSKDWSRSGRDSLLRRTDATGNGTDCWRRRTVGGRSVTSGVSRHSNQNSNWMWWAYRSSDSSRQCHSVANSTTDRLTVFVSHITHSTHCTNSELGVYPRFTALSIVIQQRLTRKVSRNRAPSLNTVAVTWLLVIR